MISFLLVAHLSCRVSCFIQCYLIQKICSPLSLSLDSHVRSDLRPQPELDRYDSSILDSDEYAPLDAEARKQVEAELKERDKAVRARGRRGFFLLRFLFFFVFILSHSSNFIRSLQFSSSSSSLI